MSDTNELHPSLEQSTYEETAVITPEAVGLERNVDGISVRDFTAGVCGSARELVERIYTEASDKEVFLEHVAHFERYMNGFGDPSPERDEAWDALGEKFGESGRLRINNEFRSGLREVLIIADDMLGACGDMDDVQANKVLGFVTGVMQSVSEGRNVDTEDVYVQLFDETLLEDEARELHAKVASYAVLPRYPFGEFADPLISDPNKAEEFLKELGRLRVEYARELLEVADALLPEPSEGLHRWEHRNTIAIEQDATATETNPWGNWEARVADPETGGGTIDTTRGSRIIHARQGFFGRREKAFDPSKGESGHWNTIVKGSVRVEHVDEATGKKTIVVEQVPIPSITLYEHKLQSERDEVAYGTAVVGKDRVVRGRAFNFRGDSLVKCVDMLEQTAIPPAQSIREGAVRIPHINSAGKACWVEVSDQDLLTFRTHLTRAKDEFGKHFDYDEMKALELESQQRTEVQDGLEDLSGNETDWLDIQRACIGITQGFETIANDLEEGDPRQEQLMQVQQRLYGAYERLAVNFGRLSMYEQEAVERLLRRGIVEGSPDWEEALRVEVSMVVWEYTARLGVYKDAASEISDIAVLFDDLTAEDSTLPEDPRRAVINRIFGDYGLLEFDRVLEERVSEQLGMESYWKQEYDAVDRKRVFSDKTKGFLGGLDACSPYGDGKTLKDLLSDRYADALANYGDYAEYLDISRQRIGDLDEGSVEWYSALAREFSRVSEEAAARLEIYGRHAVELNDLLLKASQASVDVRGSMYKNIVELELKDLISVMENEIVESLDSR
jgi:hypothetical protein